MKPFLSPLLFISLILETGSLTAKLTPTIEGKLAWYNVEDWGVEGRGWETKELARYFDRLPASAEKKVRKPVWNLSRHSAGMAIRFKTDATEIHVD